MPSQSGLLLVASIVPSLSTAASQDVLVLLQQGTGYIRNRAGVESTINVKGHGKTECPCIGIDGNRGKLNVTIDGSVVTYPADVGSRCEAWDDGHYPDACGRGGRPGKGKGFCSQKWCYVDVCSCDAGLPMRSTFFHQSTYHGRALYYSYSTCGGEDEFSPWHARRATSISSDKSDEPAKEKSKDADPAFDHEKRGTSEDDSIEESKDGIDHSNVSSRTEKSDQTSGKDLKKSSTSADQSEKISDSKQKQKSPEDVGHGVDQSNSDGKGKKALGDQSSGENKNPDSAPKAKDDHTSISRPSDKKIDGKTMKSDDDDTGKSKADDASKGQSKSGSGRDQKVGDGAEDGNDEGSNGSEGGEDAHGRSKSAEAVPDDDKTLTEVEPVPSEELQPKPIQEDKKDIVQVDKPLEDKDAQVNVEMPESEKEAELEAVCSAAVDAKSSGKTGCMCVGISELPGFVNVHVNDRRVDYPAGVGATCKAWDQAAHPDCLPNAAGDGDNSVPDWCHESWCYVDPCSCNQKSVMAGKKKGYMPNANFEGRPLYYSYKACGSVDLWTAKNNDEACVNKEESSCVGDCLWTGSTCTDQQVVSLCDGEQKGEAMRKSPIVIFAMAIAALLCSL